MQRGKPNHFFNRRKGLSFEHSRDTGWDGCSLDHAVLGRFPPWVNFPRTRVGRSTSAIWGTAEPSDHRFYIISNSVKSPVMSRSRFVQRVNSGSAKGRLTVFQYLRQFEEMGRPEPVACKRRRGPLKIIEKQDMLPILSVDEQPLMENNTYSARNLFAREKRSRQIAPNSFAGTNGPV